MPTGSYSDSLTEMNVKSLGGNALNIDTLNKAQPKERVKTFESTDRDGNGRQEHADREPERELTSEEIEQVLKDVRALPAVEKNNLVVELLDDGHRKRILIKGPGGEIIKSLSPFQAKQSTQKIDEDRPKGQLLNKAF